MGVGCFTCGKTFNGGVHETLMFYKREYERKGTERYFFKLSENGEVLVCKKQDFNRIFTELIQPNFINGAEYSHISEYHPQP